MSSGQLFDQVRKLFEDKRAHFSDVKDITGNGLADISLGNDEVERADAYVSMINKRERIFKEIDEIDKDLKSPDYFEISCNAEFNSIKGEITDIIRDILNMEEKNKIEGVRIKNELALKIKGLRVGKEASVAYNSDALYSGVSRFDTNN